LQVLSIISFLKYSVYLGSKLQSPHIPVLLEEVKEIFKDLNEGVFLDCTLGYGGHSKALLEQHSKLEFIVCDQDQTALDFSKNYLRDFTNRISFFHLNFLEILDKISTQNLCGILADIGVSSLHLDLNKRGFSFDSDFLDMRMNQNAKLSAYELVNFYKQEELARIFKEYGELKDGWKIAERICKARTEKRIQSAKELCAIVGKEKVYSRKVLKSTLVFQALRIEVNKELEVLKGFLEKIEKANLNDCVVAIICFHSLEDRIVKSFFKKWSKNCICNDDVLKCECGNNHSLGRIMSKKIITPSQKEKSQNPRCACAKMRVFYFENGTKC